jgi:hypothetical protein
VSRPGPVKAPDPAEEFPGFAPLVFVGYARSRLAEVVVTGGDVRAGELVQPLDITAERFDGRVVAFTVFADVVPIRRGMPP